MALADMAFHCDPGEEMIRILHALRHVHFLMVLKRKIRIWPHKIRGDALARN